MYKIYGLSTVSLFNTSTGEKVLEVNGILDENKITYEPETKFNIDNDLNFKINSFDGSILGTFNYFSPDFIKLLQPENKDKTYEFNLNGYREFQVQKRTHKKKRINKKWAKRYGYKVEKVKVEYVFNKCKFNKESGEFEILAEV
jgi:hypothetical protein